MPLNTKSWFYLPPVHEPLTKAGTLKTKAFRDATVYVALEYITSLEHPSAFLCNSASVTELAKTLVYEGLLGDMK